VVIGVLACVALLVAYGNTAAYVAGSALPHGSTGIAFGVALVAVVLVVARLERLTLADLGLRRVRLAFDAGVGGAVALFGVSGAIFVLRSPPLLGGPVTYAPLAALDQADLLVRVAVTMPLDTAIPEELAFRGLLLAMLIRRYSTAAAVALSALAFAAWHVVIVVATVAETDLVGDPFFSALGLAGALLAVFAGGVVFAALRVLTGSLAAPIAAHWGFNAALLVGLRAFA
jgi:membrane protease YdiL (CAAX protease family)